QGKSARLVQRVPSVRRAPRDPPDKSARKGLRVLLGALKGLQARKDQPDRKGSQVPQEPCPMHLGFNRKYLRVAERLLFLQASQRYLWKVSVVVAAAGGGWADSNAVSMEPAMRRAVAAAGGRSRRPKPSLRFPMGSPWRPDNSSPFLSAAAAAAAAAAESIWLLAPMVRAVSTVP